MYVDGIFDNISKFITGASTAVVKSTQPIIDSAAAVREARAAWRGVPYAYPGAAQPAAPPQPVNRTILGNGVELRELQQRLAAAGFDPGPIDGLFGPRTSAAIRLFEQSNGLAVTGQATRGLLGMLRAGPSQGAPAPTIAPYTLPPPVEIASLIPNGAELREVQAALAAAGFDPGPIDGLFGPRTSAAIRAFEQSNGLAVTGQPTRSMAAAVKAIAGVVMARDAAQLPRVATPAAAAAPAVETRAAGGFGLPSWALPAGAAAAGLALLILTSPSDAPAPRRRRRR